MSSASYYREQARLLLQWASDAHDPQVIQRLTTRAQDMLATAQRLHQTNAAAKFDAIDFFNSLQMKNRRSNPG
jgi:predicted mannosyl-3-phosphoglycerate phosphatase (HAD superfamily)